MPAAELPRPTRCPCLSGLPYEECCAPLHRGTATAATAEQLMRSRYSAFAVSDTDYLLASWHPSTRPATLDLDPGIRWYRLDILAVSGGGKKDSAGVVEFEAHYRGSGDSGISGGSGSLRELSRFAKEHDRWYYLDGVESVRSS
jgi:SEC-C motif-containing protein